MDEIFLKKGSSHRVAINTPMRSAVFVHSQQLMIDGYEAVQDAICAEIATAKYGIWGAPDVTVNSDTGMVFDAFGGLRNTLIPRFFINRVIKGETIEPCFKKFDCPQSVFAYEDEEKIAEKGNIQFIISELDIRLTDFGIGAAMFDGYVKADRDLTTVEYRDAVEIISTKLGVFRPLFLDTFDTVRNLLPAQYSEPDALGELDRLTGVKENHTPYSDVGVIMWASRVYFINCENQEKLEFWKERSKALISSTRDDQIKDSSVDYNRFIYACEGSSVIGYDRETVNDWIVDCLPRTMQTKNLFFALAEGYDRSLFRFNTQIALNQNSDSEYELERLNDILTYYHGKVSFFKSVYDDFDNHLNTQTTRIWWDLGEAWEIDDRFTSLEYKLRDFEALYDSINNSLEALRLKKQNNYIRLYTILIGIITFIFCYDFVMPDVNEGAFDNIRIAFMGIVLILSILIGTRIFRKT